MLNKKRFLVTSALPYANGPLHIGHLAGAYISADIFVRYLRLQGKDVVYVCGSDEHGAAITMRAKKEGISPQAIIDKYDAQFRETFQKMGVSFDIFHRTSAKLHHETSQEMFRVLWNKGEFIEKTNEQYFDTSANQFLADRYIIGTCPKCANSDAYGDQCEKCGSTLSPDELLPPIRSTLSDATPEKRTTSHWYLPLDKYETLLRDFIEKGIVDGQQHHNPDEWKAHVIGQCKSWLDGGLEPRAMTRDLDWGIDVPQEIPNSQGKKLYVWFDAPIGYISATKEWASQYGKDWKAYWQDEDAALIHFVGKDNIVFHCLIFPAMLKAHGDFNLPVNVPANQFLNLEGQKISTSRNWAVWVHEFVENHPDKIDALRYNMIKKMPETSDSEFTWKGFQETTNNELVNNLANFVNRVLVLTHKFYDGRLPKFQSLLTFKASDDANEEATLRDEMEGLLEKIEVYNECIERYDFRGALRVVMEISSLGNQLLQFNEPWTKIKSEPIFVDAVMNTAVQYVAILSVLSRPFMPNTSDRLRKMLNISEIKDSGELATMINDLTNGKRLVPEGHQIGAAEYLFTRIPDEIIQAEIIKLNNSKVENNASETLSTPSNQSQYVALAPLATYDDFAKIDLRTGKILAAEPMPKSEKLLKLTVDLGFEQRTILSGIAKHFKAEEIIGQEILVLANLAPRKMMGIESNGMVLLAENAEGKLDFVRPQTAGFGSGLIVK
jgi:methionyl-tRNA synthetase